MCLVAVCTKRQEDASTKNHKDTFLLGCQEAHTRIRYRLHMQVSISLLFNASCDLRGHTQSHRGLRRRTTGQQALVGSARQTDKNFIPRRITHLPVLLGAENDASLALHR